MTHYAGLGDVVVLYPESDKVAPLAHPLLWDFTKHCLAVKPIGDFAPAEAFEMAALQRWLDYIIIVDHLPATNDFCYRRFGIAIERVCGYSMVGRIVRDFNSEVGRFYQRQYEICISEKIMIHSEHPSVHSKTACWWRRVLCPIRDRDKISVVVFDMAFPRDRSWRHNPRMAG